MLTVDQIKNISFKKATLGGYHCDEVDNFIDDVVATVETLKKEKAEILGKLEILMQRIEEYRQDENNVHNALLSAQRVADKSLKDSKAEAQRMIDDAKAEADRIIADANDRIIKEKEMITKIEQEAANVRSKLIASYEKQIAALKELPEQGDVDALKDDLDERYPTDAYSNTSESEPVKEEIFETIEEAVEDATAEAISVDNSSQENDDSKKIQIEKSAFESKFGKLKFGVDYDVSSES